MRLARLTAALTLLGLGLLPLHAAPRDAVPLNDYSRLGQRFTATRSFVALSVIVPSWLDAEGGLTLTLWDSPQRSRPLARQAFGGIQDNAGVELAFAKPMPPGTYYWEVGERTGQTRVGLYADRLDAPSEDCLYLDGTPDPLRRFLFSTIPTPFAYAGTQEMVAALAADKPLWERTEACRQLAVQGDPRAIPVLAGILGDDTLSHLARYALEPMPDPAVDRVFREALETVRGPHLLGVVNSIAVRRDPKAVRPLRRLLGDADADVAAAAAVALGRIGTAAAADALEAALKHAPEKLLPALHEGCLEGAARLLVEGHTRRARAIYDRLRGPDTAVAVRTAALRGAIVSRGADGVPLLLEQLRGADQALADAALWVVQQDLPGTEVTQALAAGLAALPPAVQPAFAAALCGRADAAALPVLLDHAQNGSRGVRLALIQGLPRFRGEDTVTAPLLAALADADDEVSTLARNALLNLPPGQGEVDLAAMVDSAQGNPRLLAIQVAGQRRVAGALPALLRAAGAADQPTRTAALRALGELAGPEQFPALLDLLVHAATPADTEGAERALRAAFARVGDPERRAETLAGLLPAAQPELKPSLLRLLHSLGGPRALSTVLSATTDPDPEVRLAAYRLLGEWKSADAAPQLLRLAADAAGEPANRLICLRGAIRLAGSKDLPADQRLAVCRQAAPLVQRDEERKLLLAALGGLPAAEALALAVPYLADSATQAEAATAVLAIAEPLARGPDAPRAIAALEQVARSTPDSDPARRAEALLTQVRARSEPAPK